MYAKLIAFAVLIPFIGVFAYAGIHEWRRYKTQGGATYGLVYDEETGTTHVAGIPEDEESYDPEGFDPSEHNRREDEGEAETADATEDTRPDDRPA